MTSEYVCRICLDTENNKKKLIQPCKCKGSCGYVHKKCLAMWIKSESYKGRCEICKSTYQLSELTKRKTMRNYLSSSLIKLWHLTNPYANLNRIQQQHSIHNLNPNTLILDLNIQLVIIFISTLTLITFIKFVYLLTLNGSLEITIHNAKLPDMDYLLWPKSDAYVVMCLDQDCSLCITQIHHENNHPEWNHQCTELKNKTVNIFSKLTFLVYDADGNYGFNSDDLIGGVTMSVYQLLINGYNDKNVILKWSTPHPGSLIIQMSWKSAFLKGIDKLYNTNFMNFMKKTNR